MELSLSSHGEKGLPVDQQHKEKKDTRRGDKSSRSMVKESMAVAVEPVKISSKENRRMEKRAGPIQEREKRRLTLKEMEEKTYPFPDADVRGMLEDLLEKNVIKLPECKHPEEMGRTNDPKYCMYHRVVSHPVEKCFVLKDLILRLAKEGKILLDLDETAEANHATFAVGSPIFVKSPTPMEVRSTLPSTSRAYCKHIQFGTLEPMHMSCFNPQDDDKADDELVGDEEGWTFVTYKRLQKPRNPKPHVPYKKRELQASNSKVTPKGKGTNGLKKQRKGSCPNELLQKEGPCQSPCMSFSLKAFLQKA